MFLARIILMDKFMNKVIEENCDYRILCSLRRIIRAVDIYSRKINRLTGLTTPQLLCLDALAYSGKMTLSDLAQEVNLGASTVNGIVDRLEAKKLVLRERSTKDRRKVFLEMTEKGKEVFAQAPSLLQDKLSSSLKELSKLEQTAITQSLERVVELMNAEEVDASPNLISHGEIISNKKIVK